MAQRKVLQKPGKGARDEQSHAFGAREAEAFGNEFAEDDLQHGEQAEGDSQRGAVRDHGGPRARDRLHERAENSSERDFSEIAERKAGESDAHLHAGDDASEIGEQGLDDFGASVALLDELANAGLADGDQRKFGGGEEGVDADERENREKLQGDHCD